MSLRRLLLPLVVASALLAPAALAADRLIWSGRSAGYEVRLTSNNLTIGRAGEPRPFYSARSQFLTELGTIEPDDELHEAHWELLSVVGPLVSVEEGGGGYVKGTAHPYAYRRYVAMDMRKRGKPAVLSELFPKRALYEALMADTIVQQALAGKKPGNFEALMTALDGYVGPDCEYRFDRDMLSSFAFHHVKGNRVAVRIGLTHGCEAARGALTVLGMYLPIPAALAGDLAAAQSRKVGFLQERAPKEWAAVEVGSFE